MNNDIEITLRGGSVKPEPTYRFRGNGDRKGQECRILKYLSGFDVMIQFNLDGEQRVVTRSAIQRI